MTTTEHNPCAPALYRAYDDPARVAVRNVLEGNGTISSLDFEDSLLALIDAAVHEAYVNAQRAVTGVSWGTKKDATTDYIEGQKDMQWASVRAIREAAEEDR